ncbi:EamA family transporter [uncultured Campylobacter sp.]|uniref:DMT family transporter n=1 Tax=uncultured Campylobacter sp. TaxID=218934 RepID=UPI0026294D90|nr:EamA family transporter [uncultured Campylobacter sp.]
MKRSYKFGVLLVILGGLFWASSGVMAESLFKKGYSVDWVSFYRLFLTGLILALFSSTKNNMRIFRDKKEVLSLLLFACFGLLLTQFAYFKAIAYIDAGTATMIQYSAPIFIMLIICLKSKILPKKLDVLALVILLIAMFFLAFKGEFSLQKLNFWGLFWGILSAFGVVYYSLGARKIMLKYGVIFVMAYASLIGAIILFILLLGKIPSYNFTFLEYGTMFGIVFVGTILAFSLYLKGLEIIGALKASMIACIEPVAAAFMTFLFLGTTYSFVDIFAFCLIIFSVFLNSKSR